MIRLLISSRVYFSGLQKSFEGSTIIETIISLTILLTVLTISLTQIDRINASVNPQAVYKAHLISRQIFNSNDLLINSVDKIEMDGFYVEKSIELVSDDLFLVQITVMDQRGKLLYSRQKLIADRIEL